MSEIILGLGSNVGDRQAMLRQAVAMLADVLADIHCSAVYETPALLPDNAPQDWDVAFLNMAVRGQCDLEPEPLLLWLKALEHALGRKARGYWGPREIDIDVLAMGERIISLPGLEIPHAGLLLRNFALVPLADIAPGWRYPVAGPYFGKTAAELVALLDMRSDPSLTRINFTVTGGE